MRDRELDSSVQVDYLTMAMETPKGWLTKHYGLKGDDALSAYLGFADWWNANWRAFNNFEPPATLPGRAGKP